MEKKIIKIKLNKKLVANLNNNQIGDIYGGEGRTAGCTDGCTSTESIQTAFNCTKANCTDDCSCNYSLCITIAENHKTYDKIMVIK